MIKSNTKLQVVNSSIDIEASIDIELRKELVKTDIENENYCVQVQFFYEVENIFYPIEQKEFELTMENVNSKVGNLNARIELALLDRIKENKPFGSNEIDWDII